MNVISSLLKSFFRNLPDPLFTTAMYDSFIAADKIDDQKSRMIKLRNLVWSLLFIYLFFNDFSLDKKVAGT